jgi:LemA protein
VAFARNYYNGAVEAYNIKVQSFPNLLVARLFGFRSAEFFAAGPEAAAPVAVDGL